LVAVTWGGGASISRLGAEVEIQGIFGQRLSSASTEANGPAPLLLSRVDKLPAEARPVNLPEQPLRGPMPLRLEVRLQINGKDHASPFGSWTAVAVNEEGTVEITARANSTNSEDGELVADCVPGPGLTPISPTRLTFERPKPGGETFICRFRASLMAIGLSHATVQVKNTKGSDVARVALIPDAASVGDSAETRPLIPGGRCPRWVARHSANLVLAIEPVRNAATPCPVSMTSRIVRPGESWALYAMQIPPNELATVVGLRLRISDVPGWSPPPTPLVLQLVERSGGIWLVELQRTKNNGIYFAPFELANGVHWARDDNGRLDIDNVREIMVGWGGGYRGATGKRHGFTIEAIDILPRKNLESF
jgi:hypothetical protein